MALCPSSFGWKMRPKKSGVKPPSPSSALPSQGHDGGVGARGSSFFIVIERGLGELHRLDLSDQQRSGQRRRRRIALQLNAVNCSLSDDHTCSSIATSNDITETEFFAWNPAVGTTACGNLMRDSYVCVAIDGSGPPATSTSL
ncbi:hypothetical protein AJ80_01509 [Polytolypa hystricis UAMH7299]|uniref:LysM domain-containing protein n=1 Tax=Polytolypa hystricis (strain UAMH7299) TaxID=1447883 RepID=A0A2B7YZI1_POLH7|nr:hypothetical protein AJ80_01509 [Polytolypa hystricis UAMH7299]